MGEIRASKVVLEAGDICQVLLHKIKILGKNVSSSYVDIISGKRNYVLNVLLSLPVAPADFAPL